MNTRHYLSLFAMLVAICSCTQRNSNNNDSPALQRGDIVFQVCLPSEFVNAINEAACASKGELVYAHVGIIDIDSIGNITVIEAEPKNGVTITPWEQFLTDCDTLNGQPLAVVKRITEPFDTLAVINRAKSFLGQEYDHAFIHDNGKMYCSELIYCSYLRGDSTHIFEATPMNFRNSSGEMPEYWIEKYSRLGIPIPEGEPGTHPNDIAKSPLLTEVYRTF